jgi:hypothetical protein
VIKRPQSSFAKVRAARIVERPFVPDEHKAARGGIIRAVAVARPQNRRRSLFLPYLGCASFPSRFYAPLTMFLCVFSQEHLLMLDLLYLTLGLGGFVLIGAYAAFCDRL